MTRNPCASLDVDPLTQGAHVRGVLLGCGLHVARCTDVWLCGHTFVRRCPRQCYLSALRMRPLRGSTPCARIKLGISCSVLASLPHRSPPYHYHRHHTIVAAASRSTRTQELVPNKNLRRLPGHPAPCHGTRNIITSCLNWWLCYIVSPPVPMPTVMCYIISVDIIFII